MLRIKSTANYTGLSISGNLEDMNELYNAISSVVGDEGEYFFQVGSRHRVLGVCREIHFALLRKHDTINNQDLPFYAFRILWPEAAFVTAVLDNFILLSSAKKLYIERLPRELSEIIPTVSSDHIALIHYFQELIWNELERVVGTWQVKEIFGEYNELRKIHFKFPQLDGYYTPWLDLLNMKYLCAKPVLRRSDLAPILTQLFSADEGYLSLKNDNDEFTHQGGIRVTGMRLSDNWIENCKW